MTEMNRIWLFLFERSNNRMLGLYLAAIHRILTSVMNGHALPYPQGRPFP
jgi:hypothetical protein